MAVITISREIGAHGTHIAHSVAEGLSYSFVDKDVIESIVTEYGITNFDETYDDTSSVWSTFDRMRIRTADFLKRVLNAVAQVGDVVLLGRGSFGVFPNYTNVLNVRVHAPLDYRVERIMRREGWTDRQRTVDFVRNNDENRRTFVRTYFGLDFDKAEGFDIILNTGMIPEDSAVKWILEAAEGLRNVASAARSTRDQQIDPVLAKAVRQVLGR